MALEVVLTIVVLLVLVGIVYIIERRVKSGGALFTGKSSPLMRVLALVLGIAFTGIFLYELFFSDSIQCLFPILGFALLVYVFGSGRLLRRIQGEEESEESVIQDG